MFNIAFCVIIFLVIGMNIEEIVARINNGEIGIIPTDTVYGIIADATNVGVIKRVYDIKKRPLSKPLIIMFSNIDMLKEYCYISNDLERELIDKYWPGKMTLILKKKDNINDVLSAGMDTIGVRIPDNVFLRDIIDRVGKPVISTSANISGTEVITSLDELEDDMVSSIDFMINGGEVDALSSTIVKVENNKVLILREGDLAPQIKNEYK